MDISESDKEKIFKLFKMSKQPDKTTTEFCEIRVHDFLISRGYNEKEDRILIVRAYAGLINASPKRNHIYKTICSNKGNLYKFKNWFDSLIGYVKPSKVK